MKKIPDNQKSKPLIIRNSTAEFLMFTADARQGGIEVRFEDENVWLTQKLIATLFEVDVRTVNEHLKNIFLEQELNESSVIRNFRITASDGKSYDTKHYNLEAIIAIGYRVNSERAIAFRKWATLVLKQYAIRGYVLDRKRLENGTFLGEDYYDRLIAEIREIRNSERKFYQKITDIYTTALDYDVNSPLTHTFFKTVQNKLHYAIHGHTAAEIIVDRASAEKPDMGLTSWEKSPTGKILKNDVVIAKNYLGKKELAALDRVVSMYLDYAEDQAELKIPMTMEDWVKKLNAFLQFNQREVLNNPGKVSAEIAKTFAESEWEKYRVIQDKNYVSDFDREVKKLLNSKNKKI
ncbi:MAG: virulence RhuM family protein [bacterium]|nr:virulence RhuM family protein [bacterium]